MSRASVLLSFLCIGSFTFTLGSPTATIQDCIEACAPLRLAEPRPPFTPVSCEEKKEITQRLFACNQDCYVAFGGVTDSDVVLAGILPTCAAPGLTGPGVYTCENTDLCFAASDWFLEGVFPVFDILYTDPPEPTSSPVPLGVVVAPKSTGRRLAGNSEIVETEITSQVSSGRSLLVETANPGSVFQLDSGGVSFGPIFGKLDCTKELRTRILVFSAFASACTR